jgi:tetratricopeptide (TPR) repeat protein
MPNMSVTRYALAGAAALGLVTLLSPAGYAASDPPAAPKKCTEHAQGSAAWKKCMGTKLKDDAEAYAAGYWLAKAGDYQGALDALRQASNQADPRIQTMIGFSLRKMGLVDEAMAYYTAALSTAPNQTNTRQYLGEAFLQKGDRAKALEQLAEISTRCGTACEDYRLLSDAINQAG